jgi:hypothetical protein
MIGVPRPEPQPPADATTSTKAAEAAEAEKPQPIATRLPLLVQLADEINQLRSLHPPQDQTKNHPNHTKELEEKQSKILKLRAQSRELFRAAEVSHRKSLEAQQRAADAERKAIDAQNRVYLLEQSEAAACTRADGASLRAQEAEQRAEEAEQRAETAEDRVHAAEARAQAAEQRASAREGAARQKMKEIEALLQQSETSSESLRLQFSELQLQMDKLKKIKMMKYNQDQLKAEFEEKLLEATQEANECARQHVAQQLTELRNTIRRNEVEKACMMSVFNTIHRDLCSLLGTETAPVKDIQSIMTVQKQTKQVVNDVSELKKLFPPSDGLSNSTSKSIVQQTLTFVYKLFSILGEYQIRVKHLHRLRDSGYEIPEQEFNKEQTITIMMKDIHSQAAYAKTILDHVTHDLQQLMQVIHSSTLSFNPFHSTVAATLMRETMCLFENKLRTIVDDTNILSEEECSITQEFAKELMLDMQRFNSLSDDSFGRLFLGAGNQLRRAKEIVMARCTAENAKDVHTLYNACQIVCVTDFLKEGSHPKLKDLIVNSQYNRKISLYFLEQNDTTKWLFPDVNNSFLDAIHRNSPQGTNEDNGVKSIWLQCVKMAQDMHGDSKDPNQLDDVQQEEEVEEVEEV